MPRNTDRFDAWIHETFPVDAAGLGLFRMAYAAFALFIIAPGHDAYTNLVALAELPDAMFAPPPGPMQLFRGFPPVIVAEGILLLLNLALAALLIGYRTRLASISTAVLFLLVYGFSYSLGKINHNLLFVLVPIVMAGSGWGGDLSYDAQFHDRREPRAWPLMLLAVIVGFAMFTSGFAKLLGGWLDLSTQAAYGHLLKHFFVRGRVDLLAPYAVGLESRTLWEVFDYATVLFELGFLLSISSARSFRWFVAAAVVFHFGIMLILNISFHFNLIVYAAFADWPTMGRWVREYLPSIQLPRAMALSFAVLLGTATYLLGSPLIWLDQIIPLRSDLLAREVLTMIAGMSVIVYLGIREAILGLYRANRRGR